MRPVFETVVDALEHHAEHSAERIAYTFLADGERDERNLTYGQLWAAARKIGGMLAERTEAGDRAVVMLPPGIDFFPAYWGCLWAGLVPCVAYPPRPEDAGRDIGAIAAMRRDSGAAVVLTTTSDAAAFADARAWRDEGLPAPVAVDKIEPAWPQTPRRRIELAYLQYTSGSTSTPKGVRIPHRTLASHCIQLTEALDVTPETVSVLWLPVHHSFGLVAGVLLPVAGCFRSIFMAPAHFLQRPLRWLEAMSRYRGTLGGGPNFAYDMVSRDVEASGNAVAALELSSWRTATMGGEAVQPATLERVQRVLERLGMRPTALKPGYGLSEATLTVSLGPIDTPPQTLALSGEALRRGKVEPTSSEAHDARTVVGVGQLLKGYEAKIVDPASGRICDNDEVGELWLRGPSIGDGYWGRSDESNTVFGAKLGGAGPCYLRTGDLGFFRACELFISGRCKELIIVRGLNYFPSDIEASVRRASPALTDAPVAAFPWGSQVGDGLGIAIELAAADPELVKSIRVRVASEHGVECECIAVVKPGLLPRTNSGKVQRLVIARLAEQGKLEGMDVADAQGTVHSERALPKEWGWKALCAVIESVGATLPPGFGPETLLEDFALSSLAVVRVVAEVDLRYGRDLPIAVVLNKGRSIADLVATAASVGDPEQAKPVEYVRDARLPQALAEHLQRGGQRTRAKRVGHVLVTGATGYLGANIVQRLLTTSDAQIVCLVRAANEQAALQRLREAATTLTGKPLSDSSRLRVVPGDVAHAQLGLDKTQLSSLANDVDTVLHAAAHVNFVYPYEALYETNVRGTERVIEFCASGCAKRLHFLSTIGVLATGNLELPERPESQAIERDAQLAIGYEQSKWVADRMVGLARVAGLRAWTYRVGFVGGNSADGSLLRVSEFFPALLKACIKLGIFPDIATPVPLVPVDWVARAVTQHLLACAGTGADLHLIHAAPLTFNQCFVRLRERGYRLEARPFAAWKCALFEQPAEELRRSALFDYLGFLRSLEERHFGLPRIAFQESVALWNATPCPEASRLFDVYVDKMRATGDLPRPAAGA